METISKDDIQIIIIGAGISGLAAADRLINGYKFKNVTILEASDRIGGRIYPVLFGTDSYLQLGAEWLHNRHNPLFKMAVNLKLVPNAKVKPDDFDTGMRYIDQNGDDVPKDMRKEYIKSVVGKLEKMMEKGSFDGYDWSSYGNLMDDLFRRMMEKRRDKYGEKDVRILEAMHRAVRSATEDYISADDWYRISLNEYVHPEDTNIAYDDHDEDEDEISISMNKIGYKAILDEMIKKVPPSDHIKFNSLVNRISWNISNDIQKNVQIYLADGRSMQADHVIVTCSLGHLKKYSNKMFDPVLPQRKMDAIDAYGFDTVEKLMLIFEKPFWPKDMSVVNLIRVEGEEESSETTPGPDLTRIFEEIYTSKAHPNVLLAMIRHQNVAILENATDEHLSDAAAVAFRRYFKNPQIPNPKIARSCWHSNPLFHGSYSYNTMQADQLKSKRMDLAEPLHVQRNNQQVPIVLFAGEATNPTQYATTHGAFATGIREADRLAKLYRDY